MSAGWERAFLVLGGIVGASGVALSALAAHLTGPGNLETASRFLLFHAPALLALAALIRLGLLHRLTAALAGLAIVLGLILFCGDLSVRAIYAVAPLRLAAPIGGILLIAGWATLGLAALLRRG